MEESVLLPFPFFFFRHIPLPSAFSSSKSTVNCKKNVGKHFIYDRDIICLPKSYGNASSKVLKVPRGKEIREYLAANGLIGKIRLRSNMTEKEIMEEIRSVFSEPMNQDSKFQFLILQTSGGGSKTLTSPPISSSFRWTARAVAGNLKTPIYIIAIDDLKVIYM